MNLRLMSYTWVFAAVHKIKILGKVIPRTSIYETIKELDWRSALTFDETALSCWRDPVLVLLKKDTGELENLQQYIYKENLIRWQLVFSKSQVMCV